MTAGIHYPIPKKIILRSILFLITLGALTYLPGLNNEFRIDDEGYFNNDVQSKFTSWKSYLGPTPLAEEPHYLPVNYILNIPLFSFLPHQPIGFRLISLIFFLTHCALLYFFLLIITKNNSLALLASTIFLLHPLNTDVVGQISLNTILLSAVFMQLSLIWYWRFLETQEKKHLSFSLLLFIAAFLSFEGAFLLPFYLLALTISLKNYSWWKTVQKISIFILVVIFFLILWFHFAGHQAQIIKKLLSFHCSLPSYFASMTALLYWYLHNIVSGDKIAFLYNTLPLKTHLVFWNFLWIIMVAGLILLVHFRWQKSFKTFSLCYFLIGLILFVPASVGHAEMGFVIEPHWFYFASAGLAFLMAELLIDLRKKIRLWLWGLLVFSLLFFFFIRTQTMLTIGKTAKGYYTHWLSVSPNNYLALLSFCDIYTLEKDYAQVLYYSQQALKATTGKSYTLNFNIGSIWGGFHRIDLAEKFLHEAILIAPQLPDPYHRLGEIYLENGRPDQAMEYFRLAIKTNPSFIPARLKLSDMLINAHQWTPAIAMLENILLLPNSPSEHKKAQKKLALLYSQQEDQTKAIRLIEELINADLSADHFLILATEFADKGAIPLASAIVNSGIKIYPKNSEFYLLKGVLLANSNRLEEAIKIWEQGAVITPNDQRFLEHIMRAKAIR